MTKLDPMLRIREAAEEMSTTKQTVRALVRTGRLKACNISKGQNPRYRIRRDDLHRFLESTQVGNQD